MRACLHASLRVVNMAMPLAQKGWSSSRSFDGGFALRPRFVDGPFPLA